MPYWVFIDWAHIDKDVECCALNASAIYFGLCDDKQINAIVNHIYVDKDIEFVES